MKIRLKSVLLILGFVACWVVFLLMTINELFALIGYVEFSKLNPSFAERKFVWLTFFSGLITPFLWVGLTVYIFFFSKLQIPKLSEFFKWKRKQ